MVNVPASGPFGIVILTFLISGYVVPTIVAATCGTHMLWVSLLNLMLGWTLVGWLLALVMVTRNGHAVPQTG